MCLLSLSVHISGNIETWVSKIFESLGCRLHTYDKCFLSQGFFLKSHSYQLLLELGERSSLVHKLVCHHFN